MQRIRIYYSKTQALRYTGNLDVHKIWERTLRRARLPLAYSQGFHPQPKINQACPLPLGMLSRAEIVDIWLEPELPLEQVTELLSKNIPPGIKISRLEAVDLHEPALQTRVAASRYQVTIITLPGENRVSLKELSEKVDAILSSVSLPRQWREKTYDLRPYIQELEILSPDEKGQPVLLMQLSARQGATGRPEEVLSGMGFDPSSTRIERVGLVFLS
ncbi:MAG: TIGR03936 family radical SAM-associated protein [Anaerolineaceae bacterium]|jgi:radical SAM-linked protein